MAIFGVMNVLTKKVTKFMQTQNFDTIVLVTEFCIRVHILTSCIDEYSGRWNFGVFLGMKIYI